MAAVVASHSESSIYTYLIYVQKRMGCSGARCKVFASHNRMDIKGTVPEQGADAKNLWEQYSVIPYILPRYVVNGVFGVHADGQTRTSQNMAGSTVPQESIPNRFRIDSGTMIWPVHYQDPLLNWVHYCVFLSLNLLELL